MTGEKPSVWKDPNVRRALKNRPASEVSVLNCPRCGELSYYNDGSYFTCRVCGTSFYCRTEDDPIPMGPSILLDDYGIITMQDVIETECEDSARDRARVCERRTREHREW